MESSNVDTRGPATATKALALADLACLARRRIAELLFAGQAPRLNVDNL